jgi:hypothetical protein
MRTKIKQNNAWLKLVAILILIALRMLSCEYSPTGTNFKKIIPIVPKDLSILLNTSDDTIKVWGSVDFYFQADLKGRSTSKVEIYLDDQLLYSSKQFEHFRFHSTEYNSGFHKLSSKIAANSGTGSLADRIGAEYLTLTYEWILIIDNNPPTPISIISVRSVDNCVKIEWERYHLFNFCNYILYRGYDQLSIIGNQNQTSYFDSSYIGGKVTYRVDVSAAQKGTEGNPHDFEGPITNFVGFQQTESGKVKLIWRPCPYMHKFSSYVISKLKSDNGYLPIHTGTALNDTCFVDEGILFGVAETYSLDTYSINMHTHDEIIAYLGTKIPSFDHLKYIPSLNSFYLNERRKIYRLDSASFEVVASAELEYTGNESYYDNASFNIDANGTHAYAGVGTYIRELDPLTLSTINSVNTKDLDLSTKAVGFNFQVSNTNQIVYTTTDTIFVLDMTRRMLIATQPLNSPYIDLLASNDGKYIVTHTGLFRLQGHGFVQVGTIDPRYFAFIDDGEKCAITYGNCICIRQSETFEITKEIAGNGSIYKPTIDPVTGYLGGYGLSDQSYLIYDLKSSELLHKLHVVATSDWDWWAYVLANLTLVSQPGYCLPLNLP